MPIFETTIKYEANDGVAAQQAERKMRQALPVKVRFIELTTRRRE